MIQTYRTLSEAPMSRMLAVLCAGCMGVSSLAAQGVRQWVPTAELPSSRITHVHVMSDSVMFVGTADPSLLIIRNSGIVDTVNLAKNPLPYFAYPHGDVWDIVPVNDSTLWIGMQYGNLFELNLNQKSVSVLDVGPSVFMAGEPSGTVVVGRSRTSDRGYSWTPMSYPDELINLSSVYAGATEGEFIVTSTYNQGCVRITRDTGISWSAIPGLCGVDDHQMTSARLVHAVGEGAFLVEAHRKSLTVDLLDFGLFRFEDGVFTRVYGDASEIEPEMKLAGHNEYVIAAFSYSGFGGRGNVAYESLDAGRTWSEISAGLPDINRVGGIAGLSVTDGRVVAVFWFGANTYELERLSSVPLEHRSTASSLDLSVSGPIKEVRQSR